MTHNTHAELVRELTSRWPEHRVAPSLSRVAALMELLGDPQRAMPVIQVAGTNGKGSTAIMIETVLRATGLRTGRFASPHLSDVRERIRQTEQQLQELANAEQQLLGAIAIMRELMAAQPEATPPVDNSQQ